MKKLLFILLFMPLLAAAQDSTKTDTVRSILHITNSKLKTLQHVPGYVLVKNKRVVGYLSRLRKPLPKKVEVWGYE